MPPKRYAPRAASPAGGSTEPRVPLAEVGLCSACEHATRRISARGSAFWHCRASESDPALSRYPPLPVRRCHAHRPGTPDGSS